MLLVILVRLINKPGIIEPIDFVGVAEIAIFMCIATRDTVICQI